jgi:hypothetical protein
MPVLRAAGYSDVSIDRYIETDVCVDSFVDTAQECEHESR